MAGNKFEARLNIITALKNIGLWKVKVNKNFGDFILFNSVDKILVEVKSNGNSGKSKKAYSQVWSIMDGCDQLDKNPDIFSAKIIFGSNLGIYSMNTPTFNALDYLSNGIKISKTNYIDSKEYSNRYDDFILLQATDDKNKFLFHLLNEMKEEIKNEMIKCAGAFNEQAFRVLEQNIISDNGVTIVIDSRNIKILSKTAGALDFNEVIDFSNQELKTIITATEIENEIVEMSLDDYDLIGYRTNDNIDFFKELVGPNFNINKTRAAILTYISEV